MAARKNLIPAEKTKRLIQASQLINRLIAHANGEVELTQSQVNAAKIVIGKYIPDLRQTEMNIGGQADNPIVHKITTEIVKSD